MARHVVIAGTLQGFGGRLIAVIKPIDETPSGRLMETVIAGVAQLDNDVKDECTLNGIVMALESGNWTFEASLGYQTGGRVGASLIVSEALATIIRDASEALAARRNEKSQAREWMNRLGLLTRNGKAL